MEGDYLHFYYFHLSQLGQPILQLSSVYFVSYSTYNFVCDSFFLSRYFLLIHALLLSIADMLMVPYLSTLLNLPFLFLPLLFYCGFMPITANSLWLSFCFVFIVFLRISLKQTYRVLTNMVPTPLLSRSVPN